MQTIYAKQSLMASVSILIHNTTNRHNTLFAISILTHRIHTSAILIFGVVSKIIGCSKVGRSQTIHNRP